LQLCHGVRIKHGTTPVQAGTPQGKRVEKCMEKNNVISLSGGKDSTAMLIGMLERGERVHSVFFFDTGWEFPQMYEHLDRLEVYTGVKITRIHPERPFTYWMLEMPVIARKGENKGKVRRVGNGWPSVRRRWCTREKVRAIGVAGLSRRLHRHTVAQ
jgi:3'-phosphoadenosine 5'-phosphosulfate sulfotransferase (PAPS reductase)/FAD synthetase